MKKRRNNLQVHASIDFAVELHSGVQRFSCTVCAAVRGYHKWFSSRTFVRDHPLSEEHKVNATKKKRADDLRLASVTEPYQPPIPLRQVKLSPDNPTPLRPEVLDWKDSICDRDEISLPSYEHLADITFSAGHEVLQQINSVETVKLADPRHLNKFGEHMAEEEMTVLDVLQYLDRDGKHMTFSHELGLTTYFVNCSGSARWWWWWWWS